MLVFVDETGDPGLKLNCGSSKYFVVTLVVFEENEEAEALDKRVSLLKHELGFNQSHEIKFNKCNRNKRTIFTFYHTLQFLLFCHCDKQRKVIWRRIWI